MLHPTLDTVSHTVPETALHDFPSRARWAQALVQRDDPRGLLLDLTVEASMHCHDRCALWVMLTEACDAIPFPQHADLAPWLDPFLHVWGDWGRRLPEPWLRRLLNGEPVPFAQCCRQLQHVTPHTLPITVSGARRLAAATTLASISSLRLRNHPITDRGLIALAGSPLLDALTDLVLDNNQISNRGFIALVTHTSFTRLATLRLPRNRLSRVGAEALASTSNLGRLSVLDLSRNPLGCSGVEALAISSMQPHTLDLSFTQLRAQGASALASSPLVHRVQTLRLGHNPLGHGALDRMGLTAIPSLRALALPACALGDRDLHTLARGPFKTLRHLHLADNTFSDAAVEALATAPGLAALQTLDLSRSSISDRGVQALATAAVWPALRSLSLWGVDVGAGGRAALEARAVRDPTFQYHISPRVRQPECPLDRVMSGRVVRPLFGDAFVATPPRQRSWRARLRRWLGR